MLLLWLAAQHIEAGASDVHATCFSELRSASNIPYAYFFFRKVGLVCHGGKDGPVPIMVREAHMGKGLFNPFLPRVLSNESFLWALPLSRS